MNTTRTTRAAACYSIAYLATAALLLTLHGPATGQKRTDQEIRTEHATLAILNGYTPHIIRYGAGGDMQQHDASYRLLETTARYVQIHGDCYSACTLILHHFSKRRLCFGENATLQFHKARHYDGTSSLESTRWMVNGYPQDIRTWIVAMGGIEAMPHRNGFWILTAPQLWQMGYKRCGE